MPKLSQTKKGEEMREISPLVLNSNPIGGANLIIFLSREILLVYESIFLLYLSNPASNFITLVSAD